MEHPIFNSAITVSDGTVLTFVNFAGSQKALPWAERCSEGQEAQAEKLREAKVRVKCLALKVSLFEPQVTFRGDLIALPLQIVTNGE